MRPLLRLIARRAIVRADLFKRFGHNVFQP
jgi:hypothetical protein